MTVPAPSDVSSACFHWSLKPGMGPSTPETLPVPAGPSKRSFPSSILTMWYSVGFFTPYVQVPSSGSTSGSSCSAHLRLLASSSGVARVQRMPTPGFRSKSQPLPSLSFRNTRSPGPSFSSETTKTSPDAKSTPVRSASKAGVFRMPMGFPSAATYFHRFSFSAGLLAALPLVSPPAALAFAFAQRFFLFQPFFSSTTSSCAFFFIRCSTTPPAATKAALAAWVITTISSGMTGGLRGLGAGLSPLASEYGFSLSLPFPNLPLPLAAFCPFVTTSRTSGNAWGALSSVSQKDFAPQCSGTPLSVEPFRGLPTTSAWSFSPFSFSSLASFSSIGTPSASRLPNCPNLCGSPFSPLASPFLFLPLPVTRETRL
mmetsp:Transcript_50012/g.129861  ORF Transcript_50012/g.129861 Transcript_50012/m.129861 type:complete len:371 (+) Transcript_50012:1428-2540(+)